MKNYSLRVLLSAALSIGAFVSLPAQTIETKEADPVDSSLQALMAGLKLREEVTAGVMAGTEKVESAIARLKAHASPSGLKVDHDADFSYAAIEVGLRLIAKGYYAEAEKLFQAAETALGVVLAKTPDTAPRDKAMYLQNLSSIRGRYLNNPVQAKADIEAAMVLQPDDKSFQSARDQLVAEHTLTFADNLTKN